MWLNPLNPIRNLSHKLEILVHGRLWLQVLIGLFVGLTVGLLLGPDYGFVSKEKSAVIVEWLAIPGYIFLRLIKMIIIPLVIASVIRGIGARHDLQKLRSTGIKLIVYILITTILAIVIGIFLASWLKPGSYVDLNGHTTNITTSKTVPVATSDISLKKDDLVTSIPSMITGLIPTNPLNAILNSEMLGIVIFSIIIGIAMATLPNRRMSPVLKLLDGVLRISMTIVKWAMFLAPWAVFGLIAKTASYVGIKTLFGMSIYIITVLLGLAALLVIYYLIVLISRRINLIEFAKKISKVQLLAFSTSSSAAVMPLSIHTAEEELDVDTATAELVMPVATTMNMAGTALYQAIALIFLAQMAGVELALGQLILVIITLVASAIGAPGTPGVSVIVLATIAENMGIPTSGMILIIGVDRILDMFRTSLNVTGDLTASVVLNKN